MSEFETDHAANVTAAFGEYAQAKTDRLANLGQLLSEALPVLEHYDEPGGTNTKLIDAKRIDLIIIEPAPMMPIEKPEEVATKCNNFTPKFRMPIGNRETGELDMHDQPRLEAIPPTTDDVLVLRKVPKLASYEEARELEEAATFKAFRIVMNHAVKPAFTRMLNLWPDFTADLVTRISAPKENHRNHHFEAELFVAYQLMSRLVDASDQYVLKDGKVDDWYLCR